MFVFCKVGNYPSSAAKHCIMDLVAWFCEKLVRGVCVCVCVCVCVR